jgi:hypothetical protein
MLIDKINNGTQENGKGFTTAGGGIHQTTFAIDDMLPGLLLKKEWVPASL